jgi:hypothetical protein
VRIPREEGTTGDEHQMYDDIEKYARMRIEDELEIKGVNFNIVGVRDVDDKRKLDVNAYLAGYKAAEGR